MNRTVWAVAITVGVAGTSWAGPPGGFGPVGRGGAPMGGQFGVSIGFGYGGGLGFGGFGFGNYGRGVGVSLTVPLSALPIPDSSASYYLLPPAYPPSFYSRPAYPPVRYVPPVSPYRSPAAAPGGAFHLPEFTDPFPQQSLPSQPLARPRPVPPSIPPAVPSAPVPGTFRYDGDPVPVPVPDARPPASAPAPGGSGLKVSLPGGRPTAGYGFPVYGGR